MKKLIMLLALVAVGCQQPEKKSLNKSYSNREYADSLADKKIEILNESGNSSVIKMENSNGNTITTIQSGGGDSSSIIIEGRDNQVEVIQQ